MTKRSWFWLGQFFGNWSSIVSRLLFCWMNFMIWKSCSIGGDDQKTTSKMIKHFGSFVLRICWKTFGFQKPTHNSWFFDGRLLVTTLQIYWSWQDDRRLGDAYCVFGVRTWCVVDWIGKSLANSIGVEYIDFWKTHFFLCQGDEQCIIPIPSKFFLDIIDL